MVSSDWCLHGKYCSIPLLLTCHANTSQKKPSHRSGSVSINTNKINLTAECYQQLHGCSVTKLCPTLVTPWIVECQAPLSSTISWSLLKFMSIKSVIISNHLIFSFCLQSFPASGSFLMSLFFTSGSQALMLQLQPQSDGVSSFIRRGRI